MRLRAQAPLKYGALWRLRARKRMSWQAVARVLRGPYLMQKTIKTNNFHGYVPRRYYLIQKNITTNSFHGHVREDIISYRKHTEIINTNSRIHEVRYFFVKSPASSYIKIRFLMYKLAGGCPFTSWTLLIVFMIMYKKILSHAENYKN